MTIPYRTTASTTRQDTVESAVVGGGRVGERVASQLAAHGDPVTFVARNPPSDPPVGQTVEHVDAIGGHSLASAGFDGASTVLALETDDATNLLVAQLARSRFDVDRVLVRVNDPERESVFDSVNVETFDTVAVLTDAVIDQL